jgi:dual oxidase
MGREYTLSNESSVSLVKTPVIRLNPWKPRDIRNKAQCYNRRRRGKLSVVSVYITAHWRLYAWNYAFSTTVVSLQLGFGTWQCYKYSTNETVREAFGWGVPVAKFGAGALYPTFFFLVLSMSRWLATICRYFGSQKYLNWDRHRYFHIRMAIMALVLSLLHTCGHVMGTFPTAMQAEHRQVVRGLIGTKIEHINWTSFFLSRPGGLVWRHS